MTECTKSLSRVGLRRSIWRKCLLAGSVLLAMSLFFSCQPNVPSGGNSDKTYTVNHNFARVESGYDVEKEELSGPVDSETKAAAKQKDGFELDKTKHTDGKIAQATIKADGSTVVDIYYARKEVTLTFKLNGGKFGESMDDKTMKGKFGTPLVKPEEPKQDGYTFTGWEPKLQGTFPAADTTYTAKWAKGELPKYTVNHWQQNINSETGTVYDSAVYAAPNYTCKEAETKHGYEGEQTQAEAKTDYDGFELDKTKHPDGKITQVTVNADGSAVVDIYYVRKEVTLTFKLDGGKFGESTDDKTVKGKYGETKVEGKELKDYITKPEKDGMQFTGWNADKVETPASFPSKDTEYTAQWETPKEGSYKVIHWKQPLPGNEYKPEDKEEQSLNGTVGDDTKAEVKTTYTGFHLSKSWHPDGTIKQQKIEAGGKTVINIYYDRDVFDVTFKLENNLQDIKMSKPYGTPMDESVVPQNITPPEGKIFDKWEPALPLTITETKTYTVVWKNRPANTASYKVEHWKQKVNALTGKVYDKDDKTNSYEQKDPTETKNGSIDSSTAAKAKEYEGFDIPTVTQEIIKAGGSTVVKIYYVRKEVTLTFDPNGGYFDSSADKKIISGKYGETLSVDDPVKHNGDKFDKWEPNKTSTFPAADTTYTAKWAELKSITVTPPSKTDYTVKEAFNDEGMVVKAQYSDGSNPTLTKSDYQTDFDTVNQAVGNNKTVTVTYKSKTATFTVNIKSKPAVTYDIGDIIDSTDSKVYKPAAFKISKSWDKYYVIIKVEGTKYTGVRYFDNTGYGEVELGNSIANTYTNKGQPDSFHRYLSKDEVTAIFANKDTFTSSIKKIKSSGIPTNFDKQNVIYKVQDEYGDTAFFNGNDAKIASPSASNSTLPIIARDFTISE
ncbi:hypothetical protein E4N71_00935 [Treponema vincentii]|uniref:bacterial Ig-like domain-containing protein n=1 Tax=Treponema vincentii TaxID=69710 RepID=UPI003D8B3988